VSAPAAPVNAAGSGVVSAPTAPVNAAGSGEVSAPTAPVNAAGSGEVSAPTAPVNAAGSGEVSAPTEPGGVMEAWPGIPSRLWVDASSPVGIEHLLGIYDRVTDVNGYPAWHSAVVVINDLTTRGVVSRSGLDDQYRLEEWIEYGSSWSYDRTVFETDGAATSVFGNNWISYDFPAVTPEFEAYHAAPDAIHPTGLPAAPAAPVNSAGSGTVSAPMQDPPATYTEPQPPAAPNAVIPEQPYGVSGFWVGGQNVAPEFVGFYSYDPDAAVTTFRKDADYYLVAPTGLNAGYWFLYGPDGEGA
jgi:hypothetical protein